MSGESAASADVTFKNFGDVQNARFSLVVVDGRLGASTTSRRRTRPASRAICAATSIEASAVSLGPRQSLQRWYRRWRGLNDSRGSFKKAPIPLPKSLTQYRVFIGSPGGLEEERKRFGALLEKYSKLHGEPAGVVFHPVGWEDTLGGVGRPQELINQDLAPSDFAIFVFQRPLGNAHRQRQVLRHRGRAGDRGEALCRNETAQHHPVFQTCRRRANLRDPGEQLKKVLKFRRRLRATRNICSSNTSTLTNSAMLSRRIWRAGLRDHGAPGKELASAFTGGRNGNRTSRGRVGDGALNRLLDRRGEAFAKRQLQRSSCSHILRAEGARRGRV